MDATITAADLAPPVTWMIPVFNGMPYIRETLASIAGQSYRNQRVMVWDNGSTDGTVEEVRRWIPGRLPGRVVTDQPLPLGLCRAKMVELAETELLALIDADDVATPDRLGVHVDFMQNHPEVGVVGGALQPCDSDLRPIGGRSNPILDDADIRWILRFRCPVNQPATMLRRKVVLRAGNYADLCPGQDYDLWCRMSLVTHMANVNHLVLHYRVRPNSVTRDKANDQSRREWQLRDRNSHILFPQLRPEQYRRLDRVARNCGSLDVTSEDLKLLRLTAIHSARICGKEDDYFLNSSLFKRQWKNMFTRWIKGRPGLSTVWPILRWTAHLPDRLKVAP